MIENGIMLRADLAKCSKPFCPPDMTDLICDRTYYSASDLDSAWLPWYHFPKSIRPACQITKDSQSQSLFERKAGKAIDHFLQSFSQHKSNIDKIIRTSCKLFKFLNHISVLNNISTLIWNVPQWSRNIAISIHPWDEGSVNWIHTEIGNLTICSAMNSHPQYWPIL